MKKKLNKIAKDTNIFLKKFIYNQKKTDLLNPIKYGLLPGGKKIRSKMLLQVHDELVFECPEDEVKKVSEIIKVEMEKAHLPICELNVPVIVDFGEATNWSAAH